MKKLIIILLAVMLMSCQQENLKIGYVADISSKRSQLGVDARNAVQLYIKELNDSGGINGRQVDLIVKDDASDPETAKKTHQEFMEEGVSFVIGHLTSDMAPYVLEAQNENLLFLSPSMSTDTLSGLDDYVIRTSPVNKRQALYMADYSVKQSYEDVVVVYDTSNAEYTENLANYYKEEYESLGFDLNGMVAFNSNDADYDTIAQEIITYKPQTVFMIAQASDTAFIMQKLDMLDHDINLMSVSWSMTRDLIDNGGLAVEGAVFIGIYFPEEEPERLSIFKEKFRNSYNYEPTFISVLAYDAIDVLVQGLINSDSLTVKDVKKALINQEYQGLQESFMIDANGDNTKKYMLYELNNGEFIPKREW